MSPQWSTRWAWRTHFWGYSMGGWIGFGMAKYGADRVDRLVIGGSHPYARDQSPARQFLRAHLGDSNDEFVSALKKSGPAFQWRARVTLALSTAKRSSHSAGTGPSCLTYRSEYECPPASMPVTPIRSVRRRPPDLFQVQCSSLYRVLTHPEAFQSCDLCYQRWFEFLGGGPATVSSYSTTTR
jgi:pimeloyl-ACP methyl ester carboxylesterase